MYIYSYIINSNVYILPSISIPYWLFPIGYSLKSTACNSVSACHAGTRHTEGNIAYPCHEDSQSTWHMRALACHEGSPCRLYNAS